MSRIVKKPEIRRKEIVEISKILFEEKGYEQTSVENIINAAKIAKGTFYYYFKTKKDVLDEVVMTIFESMHTLIESIAQSTTLSAPEKISQIFIGSEKKSILNTNVMESIHKIENRELQENLNILYIQKIIPLITLIFNQGYTEGLWTKEISVQKMQIILGGSQFILDSGLFTWTINQRRAFFPEIQSLLESTVGAVPGTFDRTFNNLI